jgi:uncharacterized cupredoxin-like copper-binding protein
MMTRHALILSGDLLMRFSLAKASAAGMLVGVLAACAGDNAAKGADSTAAAAAAVPAAPVVYTITAKDFSFDAPDTITAGMVTLKLVNQGPELHHVQLLRLSDGKTAADLSEGLKHMKPTDAPPPWVHDVAGPNAPVPGAESSITEQLEPGTYAIVCFIPGADKVPHAMKGMVRALTVLPASGAAAPAPTADVTVTLTDYAWEITPAITAGKHILRLENKAAQSHEMFIAQLEPGKKAADLATWVENMKGPPPGKPMGGISGMAAGDVVYLPVDLAPGEYGIFCFLPDSKDGKMHIAHGMMTQITVK